MNNYSCVKNRNYGYVKVLGLFAIALFFSFFYFLCDVLTSAF